MATHSSISSFTDRSKLWNRLCRWSVNWLRVGVWIFGLALWLLRRWFPDSVRVIGLIVGIVTGIAFFYLMHYLVFTSCGQTVRRVCLPLVALIDILTIGGIIALLLNVE